MKRRTFLAMLSALPFSHSIASYFSSSRDPKLNLDQAEGIDFKTILEQVWPGDLIFIAESPDRNPIPTSISLLDQLLTSEMSVAYFTFEKSQQTFTTQLLSSRSGIPFDNIVEGTISNKEWPKLIEASGAIANANFYLNNKPLTSIDDIRSQCEDVNENRPLNFVVIESLDLILAPTTEKQDSKNIGLGLKEFAVRQNLSVIAFVDIRSISFDRSLLTQADHLIELPLNLIKREIKYKGKIT